MRRLQITGLILVSLAALAVCGPTGYRLAAAAPPSGALAPIIEQMPYTSPYRAPVTSPAPSTGTGSAVVSQTGNIVRIADFAFNPPSISVPAGTTVTWTNAGPSTHTTTADNGAWNSGPLRPGASFVQSFMSPGTFTYHCMIHPAMTGSIMVSPSSTVA
ncbi:MAG TPA: cupredoxin domain-containing protein, partial [Dehalococcoidia bacterium]|nr:cupredoxin domain-containing protein [Dehalococcoidia bacterium]